MVVRRTSFRAPHYEIDSGLAAGGILTPLEVAANTSCTSEHNLKERQRLTNCRESLPTGAARAQREGGAIRIE